MRTVLMVSLTLVIVAGCDSSKQQTTNTKAQPENAYVITAHTVVQTDLPTQEDDYTVTYGKDVLKVKYADSQTSSAKPGDFPGTGLHHHSYYRDPDLSQVPQVGDPILRCKLSKEVMQDGSPMIAIQPTSDPCMVQIGDTLYYAPSPNGPQEFTHVSFDILSEKVR
jgi:hypothetical protein